MNYLLKNIPERTTKPRQYGYTMAMDKGLSLREVEDFLEGVESNSQINNETIQGSGTLE